MYVDNTMYIYYVTLLFSSWQAFVYVCASPEDKVVPVCLRSRFENLIAVMYTSFEAGYSHLPSIAHVDIFPMDPCKISYL